MLLELCSVSCALIGAGHISIYVMNSYAVRLVIFVLVIATGIPAATLSHTVRVRPARMSLSDGGLRLIGTSLCTCKGGRCLTTFSDPGGVGECKPTSEESVTPTEGKSF